MSWPPGTGPAGAAQPGAAQGHRYLPGNQAPHLLPVDRSGLEAPLVRALHRADLDKASSPVFIQSFELTNLIDLRTTFRVKTRLVFLTGATGAPFDLASTGDPRSYADLTTPAGLMVLAETVTGIGPDKNQIIGRDCAGNLLGAPTTLVADAHAAGCTPTRSARRTSSSPPTTPRPQSGRLRAHPRRNHRLSEHPHRRVLHRPGRHRSLRPRHIRPSQLRAQSQFLRLKAINSPAAMPLMITRDATNPEFSPNPG